MISVRLLVPSEMSGKFLNLSFFDFRHLQNWANDILIEKKKTEIDVTSDHVEKGIPDGLKS